MTYYVVQCALMLLIERPDNGDVYGPAAAFGNITIMERLERTGHVTFEIT